MTVDRRAAAVALAVQGVRVFRLRDPADGGDFKAPLVKGWQREATSDLEAVAALWTLQDGSAAPWNIGIACGLGLVGVDLDRKNGKDGLASWKAAGLPECPSWTVQTPSGGLHYLWRMNTGEVRNAVNVLSGVDIRSDGGYLVAPGSVTPDGGVYTLLSENPHIDQAPENVAVFLARPRKASTEERQVTGVLDDPRDVKQAIDWIIHDAKKAVQGDNGDATAYAVACKVRDFGLSEPMTSALMHGLYSLKCDPYERDWLSRKIRSAYEYAQNQHPGVASVTLHDKAPVTLDTMFKWRKPPTHEELVNRPHRPWLIKGLLMRRKITLLAAPGGTGKSSFLTAVATALAMGNGDRLGFEVVKSCKVLIASPEDDLQEWERRAEAIESSFGFTIPERSQLMACGASISRHLSLAVRGGKSVQVDFKLIEQFIKLLKDNGIDAVLMDPLVYFHGVEENSNNDMIRVMGLLADIAERSDCAIMLAHHTGKAPVSDIRSSQDLIRGASSIVGAVRLAFIMRNMSSDEASKHGVPMVDRLRYKALVDAKNNLGVQAAEPFWYEMKPVTLANGETDRYLEKTKLLEARVDEIIPWLLEHCPDKGWPLTEAAKQVKEALELDDSLPEIKSRIKIALKEVYTCKEGSVVLLAGSIVSVQRNIAQ